MMKRIWMLLPVSASLLYVGCSGSSQAPLPKEQPTDVVSAKPADYVALPGKAATSSSPSETNAAFDVAVAVLAERTEAPPAPANVAATQASVIEPAPINPDPIPLTKREPEVSLPSEVAAPPVEPPAVDPASVLPTAGSSLAISPGGAAVTPDPEGSSVLKPHPVDAEALAAGGGAGYAVQVINGTPGRLFIEAQDSAGNIFPFGFMYANQSLSTQPQEPKPIEGELTIIIRDPDKPGAPEVRRYHVPRPADYMGKTVGVTILPGRFRASVDGEVYYSSPLPEEKRPTAAAAPVPSE